MDVEKEHESRASVSYHKKLYSFLLWTQESYVFCINSREKREKSKATIILSCHRAEY
jgi:hypothetical protein